RFNGVFSEHDDDLAADAPTMEQAPPRPLLSLVPEVTSVDSPLSESGGEETATRRLRHLSEIGLALSAERDIHRLLDLILTKSRELTGSDAGSVFTVHKIQHPDKSQDVELHFRAAQNDSKAELNTPAELNIQLKLPVSSSSLAGHAALTGELLCLDDAYHLPADVPYQFNRTSDQKYGYRTKSVLVVPLKNHASEVIGVLQLINRKQQDDVLLSDPATVEREVIPFDRESIDLAASLASQAAVALENNLLLQELQKNLLLIENLFESFVGAATSAIEGRDPSTRGHSERVTVLTVELARAASEATEGPYRDVHFTPQQLKALRYAGLLHDFGKIGVREAVLTKSHKLDPLRFQVVRDRVHLLRRDRVNRFLQRKIATLLECSLEEAQPFFKELDEQLCAELEALDRDLAILEHINDPAVGYVTDEQYARQQQVLDRLSRMYYLDEAGRSQPLLAPDEVEALSVRKGTLTRGEYEQIQEHSQGSFDFLNQISWTEEFAEVPNIAYCHHEKLNGSGYPRGLKAPDIPLESRMMTVADIYDALTAADRPYKRALPTEKALQILRDEADAGMLDHDAVNLFISQRIYEYTAGLHVVMT
ncbi:MAG: GAF domain-containing protein, partial [Armatimonadota bacterium]|nr:GAF domain-containing protein [Armatimonadota bacterium]